MTRLILTIALLCSLGLPASVASENPAPTEGRLTVAVVDVDGEALASVGLSLCPLDSGQIHARGSVENECSFQASGADGSATFEAVASGRYRLTGSLSGFADTSVFPLSIVAPRSGPKPPGRVTLLLNPVCYDC